MMSKKSIVSLVPVIASAALMFFTACNAKNDGSASKVITFTPSVCSIANASKANLISDDNFFPMACDSFEVAAYGISPALIEGVTIPAYTKVKYISGSGDWMPVDNSGKKIEYCWVIGSEERFFAYANMPSAAGGASVSCSDKTKQTLTYNADKLVAADSQKDILLGFYEGTASTSGNATIEFKHPLTAVKFTAADTDLSGHTISSIKISGLAKSGTVDMNGDGSLSVWAVSDYSLGNVEVALNNDYLFIPQNIASNKVTVSVTFDSEITTQGTIDTGVWEAGKKNEYAIVYSDYKEIKLNCTVTNWESVLKKKEEGEETEKDYFPIDFGK